MLAFEVRVTLPTTDGEVIVASWMASPSFIGTIDSRMWNGDIELVSYTGGYPDVYRAYGPMVVNWLQTMDPELQLHPVNQIQINQTELDKVGKRWIRITLWDQS